MSSTAQFGWRKGITGLDLRLFVFLNAKIVFFLSKKFLELDGSSQKHCIIFVPFLFYLEQLKEEATKPISWTAIAGGSVAGVVLLVIVLTSIVWRRRSTLCPLNYQGNKHDTDKL